MKKAILIEILLFISLIVLLSFSIFELNVVIVYANAVKSGNHDIMEFLISASIWFCAASTAFFTDLAAMILIALRDIPKLKAWIERRKAARSVAKAEKAEADKQARIAALQAELDQLKKDE